MKRLATGTVLMVIWLASWLLGGWVLKTAFMLTTLFCVYEVQNALNAKGQRPIRLPGYLSVVLLPFVEYFAGLQGVLLMELLLFVGTGVYLTVRSRIDLPRVTSTALTIIYPGLLTAAAYPLMNIAEPLLQRVMVGQAFMVAYACDTFAYLVGSAFGRRGRSHALSPELSPKKSVEGAVAGVIASVLFSLLMPSIGRLLSRIFAGLPWTALPPLWWFGLVGLACGVIGQFGDLFASLIKRACGIKDYGSLLPGHGGMLDRLDSVYFTILVCSVFYLYLR